MVPVRGREGRKAGSAGASTSQSRGISAPTPRTKVEAHSSNAKQFYAWRHDSGISDSNLRFALRLRIHWVHAKTTRIRKSPRALTRR